MTTSSASPVGFFGRLFSPRNIRRGLFALAVLVTLIGLFYTEENWRAKDARGSGSRLNPQCTK